jgi:hypothetical protein
VPDWPWPEDDRTGRRARVARMYRDILFDNAPQACNDIDKLMHAFGQRWIFDNPEPDPDETWTVQQIAEHYDVTINAVYNWIAHGKIEPMTSRNYRRRYRLADITAYRNRGTNHTSVILSPSTPMPEHDAS